jgi:hypothetical protein
MEIEGCRSAQQEQGKDPRERAHSLSGAKGGGCRIRGGRKAWRRFWRRRRGVGGRESNGHRARRLRDLCGRGRRSTGRRLRFTLWSRRFDVGCRPGPFPKGWSGGPGRRRRCAGGRWRRPDRGRAGLLGPRRRPSDRAVEGETLKLTGADRLGGVARSGRRRILRVQRRPAESQCGGCRRNADAQACLHRNPIAFRWIALPVGAHGAYWPAILGASSTAWINRRRPAPVRRLHRRRSRACARR